MITASPRARTRASELHRLEGELASLRAAIADLMTQERQMRAEILRTRLALTPEAARLYETERFVFGVASRGRSDAKGPADKADGLGMAPGGAPSRDEGESDGNI